MYAEEVVPGNIPLPPARFKTLEDLDMDEWAHWHQVLAEYGIEEEFVCLLPCRITLEEIKVWMAQETIPCDPYWLDPY